uniref:Uncharacterized protein n=1 Tax=Arion vulgaris TaxID=1028688 RepID=A0A0B7ARH6_9EUPU
MPDPPPFSSPDPPTFLLILIGYITLSLYTDWIKYKHQEDSSYDNQFQQPYTSNKYCISSW